MRCITKKNTLFDLDPKVRGIKVTQNVDQYPRLHVTYAPASLMLLHPMVKGKMHLQENTLFDLDLGVKATQDVTQYP